MLTLLSVVVYTSPTLAGLPLKILQILVFVEKTFLLSTQRLELSRTPRGPNNVLNGLDLYVLRITADGSYGLSKPCYNCAKLLKKYQIYRVYYSLPGKELTWKVEKVSDLEGTPSSGFRKLMSRRLK
jgi:hypothetical protein